MKQLYKYLDKKAFSHAEVFIKDKYLTQNVILIIRYLYLQVQYEDDYKIEGKFETAYKISITPLFEFYFGRFLYHYFKLRKIPVSIFVRKQVKKCAPDIRIVYNNRNIAIIEVKIKGGWIQPFFSNERYENDIIKMNSGKRDFNPDELIQKQKNQLLKYDLEFDNPEVYMLLPTYKLIHRKKYFSDYNDYKKVFSDRTNKSSENLIVLSKDLFLDLSKTSSGNAIKEITNELELAILSIAKKCV